MKLLNPGFESGGLAPGWQGSGNYPQYASVAAGAARTGLRGALLDDTGVGVPGIEQKLLVGPELSGRTLSVSAWVRVVSFPGLRLLLEANQASGVHLDLEFADTEPNNPNWQKLSARITIPSGTEHVMIKILSSVATADGIAYADDVQICMGALCSPCSGGN